MHIMKSKYWLDIYDKKYYDPARFYQKDINGFWIAFLYGNIQKFNPDLEGIIQKLVIEKKFKAARLGLPHFDRLIVFTSCDKSEINYVKEIILDNFNIKRKNMFWEANFESEQSWSNNGYLTYIDNTLSLYEKYLSKFNSNAINQKQIVINKCKMHQKITEEILKRRTKMIVEPVFGNIDYSIIPKSIFLIMPFRESWSNDTFDVIQDIAHMAKCSLIRGDDLFEPAVIVDDIWREINRAEIVIADITIHNANVFYEIGIAHTLGKRVILIRQDDGQEAPFDINLWRYYDYNLSPINVKKFKEKMVLLINKILEDKRKGR